MKKILCILLALVCAFSIVSCNNGNGGTNNDNNGGDNGGGEKIEIGNPLEEVVAASRPTKIVTKVTYVYPNDDQRSKYDLDGLYSLEINGSDSKFAYDYKLFAIPGEGEADVPVKSVVGTIYFKDGKIFVAEGEGWENISSQTVNKSFNLLKNRFKTYEKSEDEKTLTATITADNIEDVIGYSLSAKGDITVVVTTDGVYMRGVTISYKSAEGADVTIDTSYSYNDITIEFPTAE